MNPSLPEYLVPREFLQSRRRWGQKACQRISRLLHLHNQDLKREVREGTDQSPSLHQALYDSFHPRHSSQWLSSFPAEEAKIREVK